MAEAKTAEFTAQLGRVTGPDAAVREIAGLAKEVGDWHSIDLDAPQYAVIPEDAKLELLDGAKFRPDYQDEPQRPTGVATPGTVQAFIDYVKRFSSDQLTIWVPVTEGKISAVFNDNDKETPGWGDFRAELTLTKTPEWTHWAGASGSYMPQEDFADHIEDGMAEIIDPPAADLLEMAQSIHATNNVNFKSQKRLASGEVQFEYTEDLDATAGKDGDLKIPSEFELAIAPFIGEDKYKVKARLRYRLNNGNLSIGYKLIRPDAVLRDAYQRIADQFMGIERDENGDPKSEDPDPIFERVHFGSPASSRGK